MRAKLTGLFFDILPLVVFVSLFFLRRLVPILMCSGWLDWVGLVGSAAFVVFNPVLRGIDKVWMRALVSILSFVAWGVLLFFLDFFLVGLVFHEGL